MAEISKFKRIAYILLRILFLPLTFSIPKKRKIWVFGSLHGRAFMDNSKYFYLFMLKNHPEIKSIWISPDVGVKNEDFYLNI